MKIIRVKGVRRTGNNFLIETLRANLNVKVDTGGGSHRIIKEPSPRHVVYFITTIKNPYSWCISITNWARSSWGIEWSKATWDKDWPRWEELYKGYNNFYRTIIEFYNKYNELSFIMRYEDFLRNPKDELKFINNECNIEFKSNKFTIPNKVPQSTKFTKDRKKFYLNGDGTFGLNKNMIKKINMCVDWKLMSLYGYERIS